jgi:hypothetical protein
VGCAIAAWAARDEGFGGRQGEVMTARDGRQTRYLADTGLLRKTLCVYQFGQAAIEVPRGAMGASVPRARGVAIPGHAREQGTQNSQHAERDAKMGCQRRHVPSIHELNFF